MSTLADFGYEFNEDGELRHQETGERFVFDYYDGDKEKNQLRYEQLGEAITDHIYGLLEEAGLQRLPVPEDADGTEPASFVFGTPNYASCDRLLVLLHGSGAVRAGQWARRLIINDNLSTGTQLPYIERAIERGMAVIVLNTNLCQHKPTRKYIRGSEDSVSHGESVWRSYIQPSAARHIAIVAHSAGGFVTCNLAKAFADDFASRVAAVCFTDAAYSAPHTRTKPEPYWSRLMQVGCDWVCSTKPLGTPIEWAVSRYKLPTVSCGVSTHELSSHAAIDAVWEYIDERIETPDEDEKDDEEEESGVNDELSASSPAAENQAEEEDEDAVGSTSAPVAESADAEQPPTAETTTITTTTSAADATADSRCSNGAAAATTVAAAETPAVVESNETVFFTPEDERSTEDAAQTPVAAGSSSSSSTSPSAPVANRLPFEAAPIAIDEEKSLDISGAINDDYYSPPHKADDSDHEDAPPSKKVRLDLEEHGPENGQMEKGAGSSNGNGQMVDGLYEDL